jgi:multidrug efflux pump subunit AcrA (membrane-fusion protein)
MAMQRVAEAESRAMTLSAAIEMLSALDASSSLEHAAQQAAELHRELFAAARVMILWRGRSDRRFHVIADSPGRNDAREADSHRLASAAAEEVSGRDRVTRWPAIEDRSRHALLAVAQLARQLSADSLLAVGLADVRGNRPGVMIVVQPSDRAQDAAAGFLHAIADPLASRLMGIDRLQPTSLEAAIRSFVDLVCRRQRRLAVLALLTIAVTMLLPLPYKIRGELELQPVRHRFIAVPYDGPLQSTLVRPGDVVQQGQLLATISPREIEYELAGVRAEWNRSLQEMKSRLAAHDVAGGRIAELESERLRLQSDLLQYLRDNLEIRSPLSGVVVAGDLKQSEGMPMSRGETLFEIAPLGRMLVEIAVQEDDIRHVREGMPVEFYVHAMPHRTMSGTLSRLHPRAELRDHDNVFIAEVQIEDTDNVLRPGMRGRASIRGDRHALGWNLFHKAWFALCQLLGW